MFSSTIDSYFRMFDALLARDFSSCRQNRWLPRTLFWKERSVPRKLAHNASPAGFASESGGGTIIWLYMVRHNTLKCCCFWLPLTMTCWCTSTWSNPILLKFWILLPTWCGVAIYDHCIKPGQTACLKSTKAGITVMNDLQSSEMCKIARIGQTQTLQSLSSPGTIFFLCVCSCHSVNYTTKLQIPSMRNKYILNANI